MSCLPFLYYHCITNNIIWVVSPWRLFPVSLLYPHPVHFELSPLDVYFLYLHCIHTWYILSCLPLMFISCITLYPHLVNFELSPLEVYFLYLHCIHTLYILSCLPRLTCRRLSIWFCSSVRPAFVIISRNSSEKIQSKYLIHNSWKWKNNLNFGGRKTDFICGYWSWPLQ